MSKKTICENLQICEGEVNYLFVYLFIFRSLFRSLQIFSFKLDKYDIDIMT